MYQNNEDNTGIDLSHSLDDSISRVKFEGEEPIHTSYQQSTPKIIQWVIKYSGGYVKDEKQAGYVLLVFVAVAVIISLFLIFSTGSSGDLKKVIPQEPYVDPPKPWVTNP